MMDWMVIGSKRGSRTTDLCDLCECPRVVIEITVFLPRSLSTWPTDSLFSAALFGRGCCIRLKPIDWPSLYCREPSNLRLKKHEREAERWPNDLTRRTFSRDIKKVFSSLVFGKRSITTRVLVE